VSKEPEDIEAARAQAQLAVRELGKQIEAFVAGAGPGSQHRRIHDALTSKTTVVMPLYKKGQKLDPSAAIAKINAQLSHAGWFKLFIHLMLFIKEHCECSSSPGTSNP
jgi:hypothetical protein